MPGASMIRRVILAGFTFLFVAALSVRAQAKVLKTNVMDGGNEPSKTVVTMIRGKIGGTLRYSLGESKSAVLILSVSCLSFTNQKGVVCSARGDYYPEFGDGMSLQISDDIASGEETYVAEQLFDNFVERTADNYLEKADQSVHLVTGDFFNEGYIKGYNAAKETCDKPAPAKKN
jgi:hypothetical protein